jgi:hypothetical protein
MADGATPGQPQSQANASLQSSQAPHAQPSGDAQTAQPEQALQPELATSNQADAGQSPAPATAAPPEKPPIDAAPAEPKPPVLDRSFIETLRCREPKPLKRADYEACAVKLGLPEWEVIGAVARTEALRGAYGPDGLPTVLFERHKFSKFTDGRYDREHPDISNRDAGGYGDGSHANAWTRLLKAYDLDPDAALRSTSWGQFQMMGFNYHMTPHKDAQTLVAFLAASEANQLEVFMDFVRFNSLTDALRERNWRKFAQAYNGDDYERNNYHAVMERHYDDLKRAPPAD